MPDYVRLINTDNAGPRCDVTPLFADQVAFSSLVDDLAARFDDTVVDVIVGIDALGFILGTALAFKMRKGFVPVRKGGKLPTQVDRADFVDYTGQKKSLELRMNAIGTGARVLLVDEWIETGAQISAAIGLIEKQGGEVVGIATINIDSNNATRQLITQYNCQSVM